MAQPILTIIHSTASTSHAGPKPAMRATLMLEDFQIFQTYERYHSRDAANNAAASCEERANNFARIIGQDLKVEEYDHVPVFERRRIR